MHKSGVTATANAPHAEKGFYLRKSVPTFAVEISKNNIKSNKLKQGKSMNKNRKSVRAKPISDGAETISGGSGDGLRSRQRKSSAGSRGFQLCQKPFRHPNQTVLRFVSVEAGDEQPHLAQVQAVE